MKERTLEGFGERLKQIRLGRGLTQQELGDAVGVSNRVIAYYESEGAQPPGALLVDLATALRVSTDELLGVEPLREKVSAKQARIRKRLQRVEHLPPADQRAVLKLVDALVDSRGIDNGFQKTKSPAPEGAGPRLRREPRAILPSPRAHSQPSGCRVSPSPV